MTALAYRHPKRGKAHRHDVERYWPAARATRCGCRMGPAWERVFVDSLDPADLCKRCWPERAK